MPQLLGVKRASSLSFVVASEMDLLHPSRLRWSCQWPTSLPVKIEQRESTRLRSSRHPRDREDATKSLAGIYPNRRLQRVASRPEIAHGTARISILDSNKLLASHQLTRVPQQRCAQESFMPSIAGSIRCDSSLGTLSAAVFVRIMLAALQSIWLLIRSDIQAPGRFNLAQKR